MSGRSYVSCDQPAGSKIGISILEKGGNAADASIGMALAVSILQPYACGVGGDCNIMFYNSANSIVKVINGSGRSAGQLTLEKVKNACIPSSCLEMSNHGIFVTVPGFVCGIFECLKHFGSGKVSMKEILEPVIKLCEEGTLLTPIAASVWSRDNLNKLSNSKYAADFLINYTSLPKADDIVLAPKLAHCLKVISEGGPEAFYNGQIAQDIIEAVQDAGGVLSMDDMKNHLQSSYKSIPEKPLSIEFHGFRVWEMGPNSTGLVVLLALMILEGIDVKTMGHNSAEYIYTIVEAIRLALIDCWQYLSDPDQVDHLSYEALLTPEHAAKQKNSILLKNSGNKNTICKNSPLCSGGNTSYATAVDSSGNACSFIFSISSHFGSGIIPQNCGFVLHDRGKFFSFDEECLHSFGPNKRSLHTIIPAMVTDPATDDVIASFGVVGRWTQPIAHVQVLLNMIIFEMDPQTALDKPRFTIGFGVLYDMKDHMDMVYLEEGISPDVMDPLRQNGCQLIVEKRHHQMFGRGHIIAKPKLWSQSSSTYEQDAWYAGRDPRCDGVAMNT